MKCDQYWPSRGQEIYGHIQVALLDVTELASYTVRTFALVNLKVSKQQKLVGRGREGSGGGESARQRDFM